jgi:ATP-dependent DNA helicase RecQ
VIFHDATLREMARLRPTSLDALLAVKGVGARKADDLGETFLSAIRNAAWPSGQDAQRQPDRAGETPE